MSIYVLIQAGIAMKEFLLSMLETCPKGAWQFFALADAPMLIQRPPLFLYCNSNYLFKFYKVDILTLRLITAYILVASLS